MTASSTRPPTIYRLRLRSISSDRNADIRHLKALLKVLLRRYHFRAVEVAEEQGR
jgi:hypothetical protein